MNINLLLFFRTETNWRIMMRILHFYRQQITQTLKNYYFSMRDRLFIEFHEWAFLERIDVKLMAFLIRNATRESIAISHFLVHKPVLGAMHTDEKAIHRYSKQLLRVVELHGNKYERVDASVLLYIRDNDIKNNHQWHNLYRLLKRSSNWCSIVIYYFSEARYHTHIYQVLVSVLTYGYKNMAECHNRVNALYEMAKERNICDTFYYYTTEYHYFFTREETKCINSIYVTIKNL